VLQDEVHGTMMAAQGEPAPAGIEVCFCASFLAQTKKERGATSGLIQKVAVQISLM
jgi:hypothetical protein